MNTASRMPTLASITSKVADGARLGDDDALFLLRCPDITAIGRLADRVRQRFHPPGGGIESAPRPAGAAGARGSVGAHAARPAGAAPQRASHAAEGAPSRGEVSYIVDRNINYTNVCVTLCKFCAFYRRPGDPEGYDHPIEVILQKIRETKALGGVQILLQGGHNPDYGIERYEELLRAIKQHEPIHIHGLSPSEILHCGHVSKLPLETIVARLRAAGLDSMPGGGGEILVDRVRKVISPLKTMSDDWLNVHRVCHRQGLRTTATMMFGHVETDAERIEHLRRVRQLQDETAGFTAFISWTFQAPHTDMAAVPMVGGFDYLRTAAVSRLYIDNIESFQASFVTQGIDLAAVSLHYGMNDMGSVMIEENVVSAANCECLATIEVLEGQIRAAGFTPARRNMFYDRVDGTGRVLRRHHDAAWAASNAARGGDTRPAAIEAQFAELAAARG
ncbi:MAG TPA: CofH family radical SAM protein [Planctomycetota bacterium]|nr:CofH family radical SAM protein [Planctomycetota bacterium]